MTLRGMALSALAVLLLLVPAQAQADVTFAGSAYNVANGQVPFQMTVPAGTDRVLVVGISTTQAGTVTEVSYGAQQLTRQLEAAADGARSEIWALAGPNVGSAELIVRVSGGAPIIAGAATFTGVDQLNPFFPGALSTQNTSANSASLVLGQTATRDAMFGALAIANAGNTTNLRTGGSVDTVVADLRWTNSLQNLRGGAATRSGNTGQNMAQNAGINWLWNNTNPQALNPYAQTLIGLRASAGAATAPTVTSPTATGVTSSAATLGGNMTAIGGANITQRGVVYCTCANPQVGGVGVTQLNAGASNTTGAFTAGASGLTASTQYTYRAFATNSAGVGYSGAANFTTAAPPNQAPTANAGGPYTAAEGATVTLNGGGSSDPDGNPLTYAWDVDGDGSYDDATGVSPTLSAATLASIGLGDGPDSASVRVRVNDGTVSADSTATTLTITNVAPSATFGNGGSVGEGGTGQVSFSAVTDPASADAPSVRFGYDFDNDGTYEVGGGTYASATTATSATVPASFLADGPSTRTVGGVVIDKDGGQRPYTTTITVTNLAPTGALANRSVTEGGTATIGLTGVTDPSAGDVAAGLRYAYDFQADGTWEVGSTTYAQASTATTADLPAALTADGPAVRNVRVAVVDRNGGFTAYNATVTVGGAPPSGTLANRSVAEGSTATIGLTGVTDPSAPDLAAGLRYAYDFQNDGTWEVGSLDYATASTATTAALPAALTADGPVVRTVRVAVIDKDGASSNYPATVTVTNVAPTATLTGSTTVNEGATAQVSWTGVTDVSAPDAAAGVRYAYDFDDDGTWDVGGATYATASPLAAIDVPASFTADGDASFTVRAAVIDKDSGLRDYTRDIDVDNVAPTATLTGDTVDEGSPATVAFSAQADPSAADAAAGFTYEYDLDDDGTFEPGGTTVTLPAALTADGPATLDVHAAIIDRDGGRRVYDTTVTVANVAPTNTVTGPDAVPSSGAVALQVDLGDVSAADTLSATIDWGDGTTSTVTGRGVQTVSHTYGRSGEFTVTVVTTDSDGAKSAPATKTLTVAAAPAAPAPAPATPATPAAPKLTIDQLRVTPRCIRAPNLRAVVAQRKTLSVRFRLSTAAPVKFSLERWTGKRGASKCPPASGKAKRGGKKIPGVYSPYTGRTVAARAGVNTVTLAATGRKGKRLTPGTYLLTVTSGTTTTRTKVWVLAN